MRRSRFQLWMMLFFVFALSLTCLSADDPSGQTIRVGYFLQPGYQERTESGAIAGYNYDYLKTIARYTQWEYDFVTTTKDGEPLSWGEGFDMLERGELDLMGCVIATEERRQLFAFSDLPAGQVFTSLFVRSDSPYVKDDLAALDGIVVGAIMKTLNDESLLEFAEKSGFTVGQVVDCPTQESLFSALRNGEVDACVLGNYQPTPDTRIIASFDPTAFYFITSKGNEQVLIGLNRALNAIALTDRYYAQNLDIKYNLTYAEETLLTETERQYVAQQEPLRVACDASWFPLCGYDRVTKQVTGLIPDLFDLLSQRTGLSFEFVYADDQSSSPKASLRACFVCDLSAAEEQGLEITDSYLNMPLVLVQRAAQDSEIETVATLKRFHDFDAIFGEEEQPQYLFCSSPRECFEALRKGEADQIIINAYAANYYLMQSRYLSYLRSGVQGVTTSVCIAIEQDTPSRMMLLSILNKAIASLSNTEINDLLTKNTLESSSQFSYIFNRIPAEVLLLLAAAQLGVVVALLMLLIKNKKQSSAVRQSLTRIDAMRITDELTGLLNRQGFDEAARRVLDENPD